MFIAHVSFSVPEDQVQTALDALLAEVPGVRAMSGCVVFLPFRDPTRTGGLGIVHEWQTEASFAAYTVSDGFAAVGQILRPLMTEAPVSKRFDARVVETVN